MGLSGPSGFLRGDSNLPPLSIAEYKEQPPNCRVLCCSGPDSLLVGEKERQSRAGTQVKWAFEAARTPDMLLRWPLQHAYYNCAS